MTSLDEMRIKEQRAREMMEREGLDALALSTHANFSWFTCGGNNHVGITTELGIATAVITKDAKYIITDNIEARRVLDEEVADQGFEFKICNWYDDKRSEFMKEIVGNGVLGSDMPMAGAKNVSAAIDPCRFSLTKEEIERYRWVGKNAGEAMTQACREVERGMTEHEIAGLLNKHVNGRGMIAGVTLIAADERIGQYRHPIPTDKKVDRYVMLVTGARKWGLIISATRLVHFGDLSPELRRKHDAVAEVDAAYIAGTKVGARQGDIFKSAVDAYARTGFGEEWKLHHQGGSTGYKGRESRVTTLTDAVVIKNQAFGWNPSITGTKSEDTIIAMPNGTEILSEMAGWPMIEINVNGEKIMRPDILIR